MGANLLIVDSARESSSTILFSSKKPIIKESGENLRETSEVDNTETKSSRKQQDKYKCESKTNNSVIENQSTPQSQDFPTKRKRASLNYSELQASSEESDVESAADTVTLKTSSSTETVEANLLIVDSARESSSTILFSSKKPIVKESGENLRETSEVDNTETTSSRKQQDKYKCESKTNNSVIENQSTPQSQDIP